MLASGTLVASDFITTTSPLDSTTVSGTPLVVTGTSSQPNARVEVIFEGTDIGSITTDESGNFGVSFASVANGVHSLTLNLLAPDGVTILATTAISFAIVNPATITITTPTDSLEIFSNPFTVSGISSNPSATVNVSVDGSLAGTTTSDEFGNWSVSFYLSSNGNHAILAELVHGGTTVATHTISIFATIIQYIVKGLVPTIGSGSGPGFTYTNSGSVVTITPTTPFVFPPTALATGQSSMGLSTVTVISASTTELNLGFSLGTENIYFIFTAFS